MTMNKLTKRYPLKPETYYCDNDSNVAEFFYERSTMSTDSVLCRDCVNAMGIAEEVQWLETPTK
jgi:hypothetical protein